MMLRTLKTSFLFTKNSRIIAPLNEFDSVNVFYLFTVNFKLHIQIRFSIRYIEFLSRVSILTRDIDIADLSVCLSVRPSVRPSVTFRYQVKTA